MAIRGATKVKIVMSKEMQDILNHEDCEEIEPGSGSIHAGNPSRWPPTTLSIHANAVENDYRIQTADIDESPTESMIHSMPDFSSSTGLGKSGMKISTTSSATATADLVTSVTSPNWSGTSWTGGLTQGCTAAFKMSASVNDIGTATTSVPLGSPGSLDGSAMISPLSKSSNKLDTIRNWTISTYKISKQSIYEKLGKSSKTVDSELEVQIESLKETQKRYSNILRLARALTCHLYQVIQTQSALGECFSDLANRSPDLQEDFLCNADAQKNLSKHGQQLIHALNFFVSSVNTLCNKTMEDTLATIKQYENSRIEFDAYRNDLTFYSTAPKTDINLSKCRETEEIFQKQKQEFEKLRSDVQIKLKFLDENREKVMHKQLLLFHNAVSAYFSGNQTALEDTMKQFNIRVKTPPSTALSWLEQ